MTAFIDEHRVTHGVEPICQALEIAPSSYVAVPAQGALVLALVAAAVEVSIPGWMDESWPARPSS